MFFRLHAAALPPSQKLSRVCRFRWSAVWEDQHYHSMIAARSTHTQSLSLYHSQCAAISCRNLNTPTRAHTHIHVYVYVYIYMYVYVYIYIHMYICRRVFFFLYCFLPFWKLVSVPPFFKNLIFAVARSKMKVRNCTAGELFSVPPQGSISAPQKWYIFNSPGGTVSNFHFALCFPIFGTNWGISWKQNINWKPGGYLGGTVSNFLKLECYSLEHNMSFFILFLFLLFFFTCFVPFFFSFLFLLVVFML